MLDRVTFPLTKAQVSDFILEKEYTNFLTLQQATAELIDAELITASTSRNVPIWKSRQRAGKHCPFSGAGSTIPSEKISISF